MDQNKFMSHKKTHSHLLLAHVRKTNNNILLFYPFVQDANDSFVPCFALVLCIMMSDVSFYMDHEPYFPFSTDSLWNPFNPVSKSPTSHNTQAMLMVG